MKLKTQFLFLDPHLTAVLGNIILIWEALPKICPQRAVVHFPGTFLVCLSATLHRMKVPLQGMVCLKFLGAEQARSERNYLPHLYETSL